jgi:hypothetical protein
MGIELNMETDRVHDQFVKNYYGCQHLQPVIWHKKETL